MLRFSFFQLKKKKQNRAITKRIVLQTGISIIFIATVGEQLQYQFVVYARRIRRLSIRRVRRIRNGRKKTKQTGEYDEVCEQFETIKFQNDNIEQYLRPVGQGRQTYDPRKKYKKASEGFYNLFIPKLHIL